MELVWRNWVDEFWVHGGGNPVEAGADLALCLVAVALPGGELRVPAVQTYALIWFWA